MKTQFRIAWRYLFSKKSHNAINIVAGIAAAGVGVATMALVCVLSVLNGFNRLIEDMFSAFDPDLRIESVEGKTIQLDSIDGITHLPCVDVLALTIEENALVKFSNKQLPATIKGVDTCFSSLTNIDSIMFDGTFQTYDGAFERCVPGVGLASKMGITPYFIDPVRIYAPQKGKQINLVRPDRSFNEASTFISGVFAVQQAKYDDSYMMVSLQLAQELFGYGPNQASALEIKLNSNVSAKEAKKQIIDLIGNDYKVLDRYEQQADFFRIVKIEKWITFFLLSFILLIATFNIIGSLSMLIIEKKDDIRILQSLGATSSFIHKIFLFEGWMISAIGALFGLIFGILICLGQQEYGWLRMGAGYIIDAYPVHLQGSDVLLILITVWILGFIAAFFPARKAKQQPIKP